MVGITFVENPYSHGVANLWIRIKLVLGFIVQLFSLLAVFSANMFSCRIKEFCNTLKQLFLNLCSPGLKFCLFRKINEFHLHHPLSS